LVDLNRNYPVGWGNNDASSPDPLSQVYRGSGPFSEPETIVYRDFALKHSFSMAYSLHSGINATFFATNSAGNWVEPSLYYAIVQDFADFMPPGFNDIAGYPTGIEEQTRTKVLETAASGYWEDWMYQERRTIAPITFELYHNGSVDEPEAFIDIEDNSTHLIQEWNGIYGYFAPIESFIDDLWDDMVPAFDYLLEMTPRLIVTSPTITGGTTLGADISMSVSLLCESPRLGTTDSIGLYGADWTTLESWLSLDPEENRVDSATFSLPVSLADSNYTIHVGNNFTGYTRLVIASSPSSFDYTLLAVGAGAIAVVIVLVIAWRRTRTV
ncbi:MAG: M14 family zinc carboxypeptidase, partial [Candidatus Thorarchaeota archaeon]